MPPPPPSTALFGYPEILAAAARIRGRVYRSPTNFSLQLSRLTGCQTHCKLDHLQLTGSFKERGAANRLLLLSDEQKARGVIAASAGNHALALAYHGQQLGIPVHVVMPQWAPLIKVSNCRSFGAHIELCGESFDQARARAMELCQEKGLTYVHGFDDVAVMAGAGTVAVELLEDLPGLDAVVIPVGGGGLLAGCAVALKHLKPSVKIIAAEAENAPTFAASRAAGVVTRIETRPTLADGLAIASVGRMCFEVANPLVDDVILVSEQSIATAVLHMMELEKTVVEGAAAAPLAALLQRQRIEQLGLLGKTVALLVCGGNIDMTVVSRVIERGLAATGRLCRLRCQISDRPGGLAALTRLIADTGASVKEVYHDRSFGPPDLALVSVTALLETRDHGHIQEVQSALARAGMLIE